MRSFHLGVPILDIVFVNDAPIAAIVGGAVLNTVTSLVRSGCEAYFVSSVASDHVAEIFDNFFFENEIPAKHVKHSASRSMVSLAFRAEQTEYEFRGEIPFESLLSGLSTIDFSEKDILHYGDFFIFDTAYDLSAIRAARAPIKYLDTNVRAGVDCSRANEVVSTCDILRCSEEDKYALFGEENLEQVLKNHIEMEIIICTSATRAELVAKKVHVHIDCPPIPSNEMGSTIGAGDNFNAGVIYRLQRLELSKTALSDITSEQASALLKSGVAFAQAVCRRQEGFVERGFCPK